MDRFRTLQIIMGTALLTVIVCASQYKAEAYPFGVGFTGAPNDAGGTTCNACHINIGDNRSTNKQFLFSNIPATGYVPGATYDMVLQVKSSIERFGFSLGAQVEDGSLAGDIQVLDTTNTHKLEGFDEGKLSHKDGAILLKEGQKSIPFTWTAPELGSGNVTFYGAVRLLPYDSLYNYSLIFAETTVVGLAEAEAASGPSIHYASKTDQIIVGNAPAYSHITLVRSNGTAALELSTVDSPENLLCIDARPFSAGMYFLSIETDTHLQTRKIIIAK